MSEAPTLVPVAEVPSAVALAIAAAKQADVFAPVAVLTSSARAALTLRNQMVVGGGFVNVRFEKVGHYADELLAGSGAVSARRLSADVRRELTRVVAPSARSPLAGGDGSTDVGSPVFVQALVKAFSELRRRSLIEIEGIADQSPLGAELVRLFGQYEELASAYVDSRRVLELAAAVGGDLPSAVIVVVTSPLSIAEADFIASLSERGSVDVLVQQTGDEALDEYAYDSVLGLRAGVSQLVDVPTIDQIVLAADADSEVQSAISELLARAEMATSFSKMALLYAATSPYAAIARERLDEADIPHVGRIAARLSQTAVGRFIITALNMIDDDFSVGSVNEWLGVAPIVDPATNTRVDAPAWAALARRARLQSRVHWSDRLVAYEQSMRTARNLVEADAAAELARFVEDLRRHSLVDGDSWSDWTTWLRSFMTRYLGATTESDEWPTAEKIAALAIGSVLDRLSRLDGLAGHVDRRAFTAAMFDELAAPQSRSSKHGVFVGTIDEAAGSFFEVVVICGGAEGLMPPPVDIGFLSALRAPGQETDQASARRSFLSAVGGARHCVVTVPRVDQRSQRECRPSPWVVEQASLLAGRSVGSLELLDSHEADESWSWRVDVPSFYASLTTPRLSPSRHALQLSTLVAHADTAVDTSDSDGLSLIAARRSTEATVFDGVIGAHDVLAESLQRPQSATALEELATCPFRYFLRTQLRVASADRDDDPFALAGSDRGLLIHDLLEEFVSTSPRRTQPDQPWSDLERQQLHDLADERYRRAFQDGRAPVGLLGEAGLARLHEDIDEFLEADVVYRTQSGVVPFATEMPFGAEHTVEIQQPSGVPVRFRGRIDRVDRSPDGQRVIAVDYKTGKRREGFKNLDSDLTAGGSKLQLGVYGAALARAFPDAKVSAQFRFITDGQGAYPNEPVEFDSDASERVSEVVGLLAQTIKDGVFPAIPGKDDSFHNSFENCAYCDYDAVCPADRSEAWARKSHDENVSTMVELRSTAK